MSPWKREANYRGFGHIGWALMKLEDSRAVELQRTGRI